MSHLTMSRVALLLLIVAVCVIFGYLAAPAPKKGVRMKGVQINPMFDRDWKSR